MAKMNFSNIIVVIFSIILLSRGSAEVYCQPTQCDNFSDTKDIMISNLDMAENSIFVHPNYPNIVLNANNHDVNGVFGLAAYISTDWGSNWSGGIVEHAVHDPATVIDLDGNCYVGCLSDITPGILRQMVAKSTDLGTSWSYTYLTDYDTDKNHLWVDNSCTSPYKGRLYNAWSKVLTGGPPWLIQFSYSSDHGDSWSRIRTFDYNCGNCYANIAGNIQTDASGNVYLIWVPHILEQEDKTDSDVLARRWHEIVFTKSVDGGISWDTPRAIIEGQYVDRSIAFGPSMTVNVQTGTLFIVWSNQEQNPARTNVYLSKSTNQGANWSTPVSITDNWESQRDKYYPWISCDPATGLLTCIFYLRDASSQDTYILVSTNSGDSWCYLNVSDENGIGEPTTVNHYIGVAMSKGIVYPVWSDTRPPANSSRTFISPIDIIKRDLKITPPLEDNKIYVAANSIKPQGNFEPYGTINNVTFEAVKYIELTDGFVALEGSTFSALIPYCPPGDFPDILNSAKLSPKITRDPIKTEKKDESLPKRFSLSQNNPNPFNSSTVFEFTIPINTHVILKVYDILGREVKTLVDEYQAPGIRSILWDGTDDNGLSLSSGVYFYKLIASEFVISKKLVIIK